jgi:hypothetical protein
MQERVINKLLVLIPDAKEELLKLLAEQSMDTFALMCGLDAVPDKAENVIVQMAVYSYNQRGAEGLAGQSYSGMSETYSMDYPAPLKRSILRFRGLRTL